MSDGLFDDGAVIRRVVREGSLLAGGGCAVLLQVSNPGVGLGVHEHSDFAYRPVDRLRTTMTYIYAVVFGTREEAERVGRIVSAMHRKVTGPTYSANDPELQVWVNATLYHTGMRLHRALFGPLPEAQADEVYQQYRVLATTIGTPEGAWPANRTEFDAYWDLMIKSLRVNDEARFLARQLLEP
ncbi:oxygenase MpaB family protein, partial [Frankia sp. EI5c]|uniref:oxygenase MpaB family protein n=1 Tax=Frankia sp. EI5c TaxID=683316 RepID=UPI0037BFE295